VILPRGSYFGDFYILHQVTCLNTLMTVSDDEIKTYAPDKPKAPNACFTISMQKKYYERLKTKAEEKKDDDDGN
jgi:hypothetical protein